MENIILALLCLLPLAVIVSCIGLLFIPNYKIGPCVNNNRGWLARFFTKLKKVGRDLSLVFLIFYLPILAVIGIGFIFNHTPLAPWAWFLSIILMGLWTLSCHLFAGNKFDTFIWTELSLEQRNRIETIGNKYKISFQQYDIIDLYSYLFKVCMFYVLDILPIFTILLVKAIAALIAVLICGGIAIFIIGSIFPRAGIYVFDKGKCLSHASVESIGGCDSSGVCGVRLSDGQIVTIKQPVKGQYVCAERSKKEVDWKQ